jgi:hypothetical protein
MSHYKTLVKQIHEDIDAIDSAVNRLGQHLEEIRDKRLYFCGGYGTFKDFCEQELGKSRQQAFRLIQASETITALMEAGVQDTDLPTTERLCREIRKLDADQQAPVWKAALKARKLKDPNAKPSAQDLREARDKNPDIINSPSHIQRQQDELMHRFKGAAKTFKVGLRYDLLTPEFRKELLSVLQSILASITLLEKALQSPAVAVRAQAPEK